MLVLPHAFEFQNTPGGQNSQSEGWKESFLANILLTWMEFTQVKGLGSALLLKHSSKINMSYKLLEAIFNSHLLCTNDQFIINAERDLKQCLCH